jgi:hypothetical protein
MEINGVNSHTHVHPLGKLHPKDQQEPEPAEQATTGQESTVQQTVEDSDSEGVIRLLQEGHFKGTADVRLRINFADKIAALEAQQLQAVAEEKVDGILETVNTILGALVAEEESPPVSNAEPLPIANADLQPIDEDGDGVIDTYGLPNTSSAPLVETTEGQPDEMTQLQDIFTQTVTELKEDFLTAPTPSTDTLLEGIQSAFDELIESMQAELAPPEEPTEPLPNTAPAPPEEPSEPMSNSDLPNTAGGGTLPNINGDVIEPEPAVEPTSEAPSIIDELTDAFKAAMDELINGFESVNILPPVSEPEGNGRAYQKFLDIYNEMREGTV